MALLVDIRKKLGDFSLDIKFDTNSDITALFGMSGSGKSLTLKCIAGIITPDEGRIVLNDRVLFDSEKHINVPAKDRKVGYLFQQYALFPNMTVYQNVRVGFHAEKKRDRDELTKNILKSFRLSDISEKYPCDISGGESQRTALARILASKPELILLDEPFSAVDTYLKSRLIIDMSQYLKDYCGEALFVSHNSDEVSHLCDDICVIHNGYCRFHRNKHDISNNPKTVTEAIFLGIDNILDKNIAFNSNKSTSDEFEYIAFKSKDVHLSKPDDDIKLTVKVLDIVQNLSDYTVVLKDSKSDSIIKMSTNCISNINSKDISISVNPDSVYYLKQVLE